MQLIYYSYTNKGYYFPLRRNRLHIRIIEKFSLARPDRQLRRRVANLIESV